MATFPSAAPRRSWVQALLWIDGLAALSAGLLVLTQRHRVQALQGLPLELITTGGVVNLAYASYSLTLASWPGRRVGFVAALAAANAGWCVLCVVLAARFWREATAVGVATLLFEGAFVLTLAILEWRNRRVLAGG